MTWNIENLVDNLQAARRRSKRVQAQSNRRTPLPNSEQLALAVYEIKSALFPRHAGAVDHRPSALSFYSGSRLNDALWTLVEQIENEHAFEDESDGTTHDASEAVRIVEAFAADLPHIYETLESDILAAFTGDPSAHSTEEVLLSFAGVKALIHHRIAHALHREGAPIVARIIASLAHAETGIDIHPGATIGGHFFIDHGTGVVIGETTVIGERVRVYQAVTLGAKRFSIAEDGSLVKGETRHPIIEDDVIIYAGATILGRVTVGKGSTIGGNVWLTRSVPPGTNLVQAQARAEVFDNGGGI